MTEHEFETQMARLEVLFNAGMFLAGPAKAEYFETFRFADNDDFQVAVGLVTKSFRPTYSEKFPSIATLQDALFKVLETRSSESQQQGDDQAEDGSGYCQACNSSGWVLGDDDVVRPCVCEAGRLRQATQGISPHDPERKVKIQAALNGLPASRGPVRGLREKGPDGLWQDTAAEHDRKSAAMRLRYALLARRRERSRGNLGEMARDIVRQAADAKERQAGVEQDDEPPFLSGEQGGGNE